MAFIKHRDEKEKFAFDFANRLAQGEILSAPQVKIAQRVGRDLWQDRTAEFLDGAPTIDTTKAQFTLKVAGAVGEQLSHRDYDVYVAVSTNQGRILVGTTTLDVVRVGT